MNKEKLKIIGLGMMTGIINGLFGSGGGTIIVPTLIYILGVDDYKAHGTAIAVILPLSIISTIIYMKYNVINYDIAINIALGGILGSYFGAKYLNKVPIKILRKVFGGLIIFASLWLMLKWNFSL